jgi:DHA1 family tetracycline resistance protein-like MFS transporter
MALAQTFVTGPAIARFGEARTVVIGMVVGGLAFLAYVFARPDWLVFTIIFLSAGQGLVWPSMNALLSRMTDASHQGALQGGMASIASVAAIVGPLAMTQALAVRRRAWGARRSVSARVLAGGLRARDRHLWRRQETWPGAGTRDR